MTTSNTNANEAQDASTSFDIVDDLHLSTLDLQRVSLLLLAGLVVRLLYVALVRHDPLFFSAFLDADAYRSWANSISQTGSFWPEVPDHGPFYSYVNYMLLLLFDELWTPLYGLQTVLGLFSACLVFVLGRTLFRRPVGYLGMVLFLFHPDWIVLETRPVPTVWVGCVIALGAVALMQAVKSDAPQWGWLTASSFCFVFAVGLSGSVLFVLPVLLIWLFFCYRWSVTQRFRAAMVWGGPLILCVIGILYLNHRTMVETYESGGWVLQGNSGQALYGGTGPGANGYPASRPGLRADRIERRASNQVGDHPARRQQFYVRKTLEHVLSHPVQALQTTVRKGYYLISNYSIESSEPVAALKEASGLFPVDPVPFGFFVVLGAIGLVRTFRRGGAATGVSLIVLSLMIGPLLTGASVRDRLMGGPLLAALSGHGLMGFSIAIQRIRVRQLLWIFPVTGVCMIGFVPLFNVSVHEDRAYLASYWRAKAAWSDGNHADAIEFLKSGRTNSRLDWSHRLPIDYLYAKYNVERLSRNKPTPNLSSSDPLLPLTHLIQTVEARDVRFPEVYKLMGRVRRNKGQYSEAIEHFRNALSQELDRDTWRMLGETLIDAERSGEAVDEMTRALKTFPNCLRCRLVRGRAFGLQKKWDRATADFKKVIRKADKLNRSDVVPQAHYYSGYVYERTGRPDQAFAQYKQARKLEGAFARKAAERAKNLRKQIEQGNYGRGGSE